ncbi:glycosyltransferase family 2 protein [Flavobacterium notoginsengisoli]|uniref:glycosyltransferase family 2 protein n=1 Tax=Flavobacterium notoginsengisoli TaxID=1478199 RepID=UPI003636534F
MITLVLTNRNRDLRIIKNCLDSLEKQSNKNFELFFVDYGSNENYLLDLEKVISEYVKIKFISCPVSGQLWNKSRAINIALKKCTTPFFMVGDIDLIFAPHFISTVTSLMKDNEVHYFQYGFLSQKESLKGKIFESYVVDFKGSQEVTGTTSFPTSILKEMQGYDEFYHGWGAEDTDIHLRMKNFGLEVKFYDKETVVKHQWHPKQYRSKFSTYPFHSCLERINHAYMILTKDLKRTVVNQNQDWGKESNEEDYKKLNSHSLNEIVIQNSQIEISAVLAQLKNFKNELISLRIEEATLKSRNKNKLKRIFRKKSISFIEMEEVNNLFLEEIIKNYRNLPYQFSFDRKKKKIQLKMYFSQ